MVDRHLLRDFDVDDAELEAALGATLAELDADEAAMDAVYNHTDQSFETNELVTGTVIRVESDEVLVDIGYKSEGIVQRDEWGEEDTLPEPGDSLQVLLEDFEDSLGLILLSKRKAERMITWMRIVETHSEGDKVTGNVQRKIKGGLLVNIGKTDTQAGVNVFLPASQVDIRRPPDIAEYIGQDIDCVILKIDEARKNIVVSRRKLIEDERDKMKKELLQRITEGDVVKGQVKNIADFGAFVDLGGIDGLLHITDMSWGRISHPTEMVKIDDEIEVMILNIDREKDKIALGLKQKTASPWENITDKYPVGTRVNGEVVNVMTYGAFVKLEDGIEGLVHISEMSWTKRVNHPSELVSIGDEAEVVVLGINEDKQEISLGMKQTQANPWENVLDKYPENAKVKGVVRNLTNYGAFVELEEGVDGLLHVSDMSWTRKISHASEMLKKGDEVECLILSVDSERRRIALGLKQLDNDPWETRIPELFKPGTVVTGTVTKITNFGVFVQLEEELEGLLHVSELAEGDVNVGEQIQVRILRVDSDDRKIGLSRKLEPDAEELAAEAAAAAAESSPSATSKELKGGMGSGSGPLFSMPVEGGDAPAEEPAPAEPAAEDEAPAEESPADATEEASSEEADSEADDAKEE